MTAEKKKRLRRFLMVLGPLAVAVVVAFVYAFSGRYVSTDNSYVKANKIMVSPEVSGVIRSVEAADNQPVHKGDVLFTVEDTSFAIAVDKAKADLAAVRTQVEDMKSQVAQKREEIKIAEADAAYSETQYKRRMGLGMKDAVSQESVDAATHDRDTSQAKVKQLHQELEGIIAQLGGDADAAVEEHPLYKAASATLDAAKLNLDRTAVRAPASGITGSMPHVGDYAHAGVPLVGMVEDKSLWVEANFKETELTNMRPGQKVVIEVDTYPAHEWSGTVESIAPATGAEFSILPAQNATGNWVKVVQRIAVRIRPDRKADDPPLHTGMSAVVTVDTGSYPHLPHMAQVASNP